jgi:1-deoxy-D-xylulose-5-phosphate reductoisomerase
MVMGGRFVFEEAKRSGATILPVDSEHFALFTLIAALGNDKISELVLTASGGAFRDAPLESLHRKTFRDALAHPTWNMGPKITVDSATMANKGLEVIEAVRLFDANPDMVKVSIHKQSKVHALVRATDGCFFAHVSGPDMRLPIDASFAWPSQPKPYGALALEELGELTFEKPDTHRYPMLPLAYRSLEAGESHCIAYNASNEIAVAEFSAGRIGFTDIVRVVERTLSRDLPTAPDSFDDVIHIDSAVRRLARIEADSIIYDKGGTH